jgi:hypothetical protein
MRMQANIDIMRLAAFIFITFSTNCEICAAACPVSAHMRACMAACCVMTHDG